MVISVWEPRIIRVINVNNIVLPDGTFTYIYFLVVMLSIKLVFFSKNVPAQPVPTSIVQWLSVKVMQQAFLSLVKTRRKYGHKNP